MSSLNTLMNASGFQHISHQKLMEKDPNTRISIH